MPSHLPDHERLLLDLMHADAEDAVIDLLKAAALWDDDAAWRYYNDEPDNFDRAGNQQRNPEAALVEKVVNSVDANLLRRALVSETPTHGPDAPTNPREAVALFYEGAAPGDIRAHQGSLAEWTASQLNDVSRDITLALTGHMPAAGYPCISIADAGEGQAPERLPQTILSLSKGIKKGIPFVQGRFNMGGTGALRFCGVHNLQLVVSKRHPALAAREGVSSLWGYTVVRREYPNEQTKVSTYRYLAPVDASSDPNHGGILTVDKESLPIFPEVQRPYARESAWGTLMKLYEFKTKQRTHMFMKGGLQERLDLLLPGLVLPVRLHECRPYGGKDRSFETTLTGLEVRLREGRNENVEPGFPDSGRISIQGQEIPYTIYALRAEHADTYKRDEGVLFVLGGQTHAIQPESFFRRKTVQMSYLAQSLLVVLDCSRLSDGTIENLFMNSRDRLADAELAHEILTELADDLKNHAGLRRLREQRRQAELSEKLSDQKPLEEVLSQLFKRSPALARLFLAGTRLSNPFATVEAPVAPTFEGKDHPTYFRFRDMDAGEVLRRDAFLGQRLRLTLETDVVNEYFRRSVDPGEFELKASLDGAVVTVTHTLNLFNGLAHLNITIPEEARPGSVLTLEARVIDWSLVEEFVNEAVVDVKAEVNASNGGGGSRGQNPPKAEDGAKGLTPAGIAFPNVTWVGKEDWNREGWVLPMDQFSGLRATLAGDDDGGDGALSTYDFYVNEDNVFLQTELKGTKLEPELLKSRFLYGLTLVALGALKTSNEWSEQADGDDSALPEPEQFVALTTDAVAPMLLPMIDGLGALDLDAPAEVPSDTEADALSE